MLKLLRYEGNITQDILGKKNDQLTQSQTETELCPPHCIILLIFLENISK